MASTGSFSTCPISSRESASSDIDPLLHEGFQFDARTAYLLAKLWPRPGRPDPSGGEERRQLHPASLWVLRGKSRCIWPVLPAAVTAMRQVKSRESSEVFTVEIRRIDTIAGRK